MREIQIAWHDNGKRLESYLKKEFPIGYVRKLFRKDGVRVNGRRGRPDDLVRSGDRVQLYIPFEPARRSTPSAKALTTVYEDQDLIVVDKPAGLAVHEAKGILRRDTVIGQLEAHYSGQDFRPRLVHRIDQDTSGLLLVAKGAAAAQTLEAIFQENKIDKLYLALVAGRLPHATGVIEFPLAGRMEQLVHAKTRYKVKQRFGQTTLVEAHIDTGRMHQIRLHFAQLGYPVVMDERHGDFAFNRSFRRKYGLKRQFLHAAQLSLAYGGKKRLWSAPLAQDLVDTLSQLQQEQR